ncbi:MAG: hypothetical protein FJ304_25420 [Planctomycetes bacterium]|nr:hypothetical protein [Planctomycetota bacterium]
MSNEVPSPITEGGGSKSLLKLAVPLLALFGVVFGVVFLSQNAPKDPDAENKAVKPGEGGGAEPPLRFFTSARAWDHPDLNGPYRDLPLLAPSAMVPEDGSRTWAWSLQDRIAQGVYEPSPDVRRAPFWFENRNPNSVTVQLKGVSCSSCSGGRLAALPAEATKHLLQHAALAAIPTGTLSGFSVGMIEPAAGLFAEPAALQRAGRKTLEWTEYKFEHHPNAKFNVPAANNTDGWSPQWGILELTFTVGGKGADLLSNPGTQVKPLRAAFATQVDGTSRAGGNEFMIAYEVAPGCELSRATIDVGKLDQLSGDQTHKILVFSSTRGPGSEFGDLTVPACLVQTATGTTDTGGFFEVTKVERVPDTELVSTAVWLEAERKRPARVRAAYWITLVVRPKVGDKRMEIGAIDRTVAVSTGAVVQQLKVTGMLKGVVRLDDDRTDVALQTFKGGEGTVQKVTILTEKTDTQLALVDEECSPRFYQYELTKQPNRGGLGCYELKITVPKGKQYGNAKGDIVLEIKGGSGQRVRIPIRGSATF